MVCSHEHSSSEQHILTPLADEEGVVNSNTYGASTWSSTISGSWMKGMVMPNCSNLRQTASQYVNALRYAKKRARDCNI